MADNRTDQTSDPETTSNASFQTATTRPRNPRFAELTSMVDPARSTARNRAPMVMCSNTRVRIGAQSQRGFVTETTAWKGTMTDLRPPHTIPSTHVAPTTVA